MLKEDIRKIDAGETKATAEQRAFLVGAASGLKLPGGTQSGGLPVDHMAEEHDDDSPGLGNKGCDGGRPANTRLACHQNPA